MTASFNMVHLAVGPDGCGRHEIPTSRAFFGTRLSIGSGKKCFNILKNSGYEHFLNLLIERADSRNLSMLELQDGSSTSAGRVRWCDKHGRGEGSSRYLVFGCVESLLQEAPHNVTSQERVEFGTRRRHLWQKMRRKAHAPPLDPTEKQLSQPSNSSDFVRREMQPYDRLYWQVQKGLPVVVVRGPHVIASLPQPL